MSVDHMSGAGKLESFWAYREHIKAEMGRVWQPRSAESESEYHPTPIGVTPLDERLLQAIWANQLLRPEGLRLADGRPVRVLDQGRWNGSAGPDFRDARLMIGPDLVTGDIEIHLKARMWRAHKHDSDLDYNGCVLHVVLEIDDDLTSDTLHNGRELPRLEMEPFLFPDIDTIRRSMTPDDYPYERPPTVGKCHDLMTSLEPEFVADFLDRAGDERFFAKVRRLEELAASTDMEQVFYQAIMMALGTGATKSLYYLLAKRAPLRELIDYAEELDPADRRMGIESILVHVAGLAIPADDLGEAPPESVEHARELERHWARFEPYWADRTLAPTRRWFRGIRPVNFPPRRLSAIAQILAGSIGAEQPPLRGLYSLVRDAAEELARAPAKRRIHPVIRRLVDRFRPQTPGDFWMTHYSLTARPAAREMALIGESTARSIVFNAVLPALAMQARAESDRDGEDAALRLFAIFPPLQSNHITQFMTARLFGESDRAIDLLTTERRRQAMFQIFHACCIGEERYCDQCYYLTGNAGAKKAE